MTQTGSTALTALGWISLGAHLLCAGAILFDIVVRGNRQRMAIMNWVWPISALYLGLLAIWGYFRRDRAAVRPDDRPEPRTFLGYARRHWWPISKGVSHCGAGCTLGDIAGEWLVYVTAWTIPILGTRDADSLMAMFAVDFFFAWSIGIVFQYFSIAPMREDLGRAAGLWAAVKADTLSIVAFPVGLFGFMALVHLVLWQPPLSVASSGYWLMMQVGMIAGFATAWPVNAWLLRKGLKELM